MKDEIIKTVLALADVSNEALYSTIFISMKLSQR